MTTDKGMRERAFEACALERGVSVEEFKRQYFLEMEIKRARARGAADWEIEAIKNCPTDMIRGIAMRDNRAPTGPSSAGIVPTSQQVSQVRVGGAAPIPPGSGTGWMRETPLGPQPGINHVDRLMDAQDRRDRADLIQRHEAMRRARGR